MSGFLDMGEHGAFVWGAYGAALLLLGGLVLLSVAARRRARRELAARGPGRGLDRSR
jgi:heme exporter protein CcmD